MHDADLGDMLDSAFAAAYDHARGFDHGDPLNCNACAKQRAEILAHVREREVELMALAMFRHQWWNTPETPSSIVTLWRDNPPEKEPYLGAAMEVRDAFDQMGEGET